MINKLKQRLKNQMRKNCKRDVHVEIQRSK